MSGQAKRLGLLLSGLLAGVVFSSPAIAATASGHSADSESVKGWDQATEESGWDDDGWDQGGWDQGSWDQGSWDQPESSSGLALHGFAELAVGARLNSDPVLADDDLTLAEFRNRLELEQALGDSQLSIKADLFADGVEHGTHGRLRELKLDLGLSDSTDVRLGRQVLTWGTGDLLFLNDLQLQLLFLQQFFLLLQSVDCDLPLPLQLVQPLIILHDLSGPPLQGCTALLYLPLYSGLLHLHVVDLVFFFAQLLLKVCLFFLYDLQVCCNDAL